MMPKSECMNYFEIMLITTRHHHESGNNHHRAINALSDVDLPNRETRFLERASSRISVS